MPAGQSHWLAFAVALGCGLLIGIERERRKGIGEHRAVAGLRTFAITALGGALAATLDQPLLLAAGALLIIGLSVTQYWRDRSPDPGITTEIALFVTYVLGATAVTDATLAGGATVVVATLLTARSRLHRFATEVLTETELRDGLILAGAALVVLPLMPDRPLSALASINPRTIWRLVVLLLGLQAAGYVALRLLGPRLGLALSGLASGFVSSTATFASMGAQARADPTQGRACASGALMSNLATLIQIALVVTTVAPAVLSRLWPGMIAAGAAAGLSAALTAWRTPGSASPGSAPKRVFDLPRSLAFAGILGAMSALVGLASSQFGNSAAIAAAALAGLVDVHASVSAVCSLVAQGSLPLEQSSLPVLLGFSANTLSKLAAATLAGGLPFAARVFPGLATMLAAFWLAEWLI